MDTTVGKPARTRRSNPHPVLGEARFEIIPIRGVIDQLAGFAPGTTVTVTSSPSRGVQATLDVVDALAGRDLRPVPHLAARSLHDAAELSAVIGRLDAAGVREVFVVGGDAAEPAGAFPDGLSLLQAMNGLGHPFERIGVPSYPEAHHLVDADTLWAALDAKQRFATYTVTQLCFDAGTICRFVAEARRRGIGLPVVAGVPGVVDPATLLRVSLRIGIGDSVRFVRGNRFAVRRLLSPRGHRPDGLVRKLARQSRDGRCEIAGLHIYTFNRIDASVRWLHDARRRASS